MHWNFLTTPCEYTSLVSHSVWKHILFVAIGLLPVVLVPSVTSNYRAQRSCLSHRSTKKPRTQYPGSLCSSSRLFLSPPSNSGAGDLYQIRCSSARMAHPPLIFATSKHLSITTNNVIYAMILFLWPTFSWCAPTQSTNSVLTAIFDTSTALFFSAATRAGAL
ncbi:hypothetical protein BOTBODRAFT_586812 [Botryobasidium botryosum FD-172 SS1]|uniref:Uncharacterized protein n=1 Tax=Botryobasidium botryosum (strain FD-172 SS1) TaxID=930990 RepID=A0A067M872_BOTB1|nr:hypothetical protein BOTBODRAFT_586812 [Botryobasidium botryosum FD-172 SS1]